MKYGPRKRRKPGYQWRTLAHTDSGHTVRDDSDRYTPTCFDELVIDDWLHLEQMDDRAWWMRLGDYVVWIRPKANGTTEVSFEKEPV